jgi:hypothetical protein
VRAYLSRSRPCGRRRIPVACARTAVILAAFAGCVGKIGDAASGSGAGTGSAGSTGTAGAGAGGSPGTAGTGGTGSTGVAGNAAGGATGQPDPGATEIPARIRRLTNAEYDHTVAALLGTTAQPGLGFTPDSRQSGFTINADQRVDGVLADQLKLSAETLARQAVSERLATLVPCAAAANEACAGMFIDGFGRRAFRRPLTSDEKSGLLEVFRVGIEGGSFADGVELVITAVLQAPAFLYLTELGASSAAGPLVTLTDHEAAAQLAYVLTGGPPDDALAGTADAGGLRGAAARATEARRLLTQARAGGQTRRLLEEWLGIDSLSATDKDTNFYPRFRELRPAMQEETGSFIDEVLWRDNGSLGVLLTADFTVAPPALASFYGLAGAGGGRLALAGVRRRGILHHASFLSVHAHADSSAPVIRGAVIRRKLFCQQLALPTDPNVVVVFPPPDPSRTTRERYEAHVSSDVCRGCHAVIDPMGFAFEGFDGMGASRTRDNNKPVDTSGTLIGTDVDGAIADSVDLVMRLGGSAQVRSCFARNVVRFGSAQASGGVESQFLKVVASLPAAQQDRLLDLLVAFAGSELFVNRRVP